MVPKIREKLGHRPVLTASVVLMVVTAAVFANSLGNGFVWDDFLYIADNPLYRGAKVGAIFTSLANGLEYLPVRDLSYVLDFAIGGGKVAVFHADNLAIYCLTVLAVFAYARCLYRLLHTQTVESEQKSFAAGFFTALLFAVHPVHSEVVNFITCRNALLSTLFFFIAALLFHRFLVPTGDRGRMLPYATALICFVLSLFAKANSIILPLVLLLYLPHLPRGERRRGALSLLPVFVVAAASFLLFTSIAARSRIITDTVGGWTLNGCITKVVKALQIIVFYLWKFIWPFDVSAAYDTKFAWSPADPGVIGIFAGLVVVLALAFYLRKSAPCLFFGICWYLIALGPVLNFFSTFPPVSDRYAFLPSFAFFFVVSCAGVQLSDRIRPVWPVAAAVVLMVFWGSLAVARNTVWFSEETLWQDTVRTSPGSIIAHRNLGNIYLSRGEYDKAMEIFADIANSDPLYHFTAGLVAYNLGDLAGALDNFRKSLGRNPQFLLSLYYSGLTYERLGNRELSLEYFRHAMQSPDPDQNRLKEKAEAELRLRRAIP